MASSRKLVFCFLFTLGLLNSVLSMPHHSEDHEEDDEYNEINLSDAPEDQNIDYEEIGSLEYANDEDQTDFERRYDGKENIFNTMDEVQGFEDFENNNADVDKNDYENNRWMDDDRNINFHLKGQAEDEAFLRRYDDSDSGQDKDIRYDFKDYYESTNEVFNSRKDKNNETDSQKGVGEDVMNKDLDEDEEEEEQISGGVFSKPHKVAIDFNYSNETLGEEYEKSYFFRNIYSKLKAFFRRFGN